MFGIGFGELVVIGLVAVIVFGPERLPEIARQTSQFVRTARQVMAKARHDLAKEMGDDYDELRRLADVDPRRTLLDEPQQQPSPAPPSERPLGRDEIPPYDREAT